MVNTTQTRYTLHTHGTHPLFSVNTEQLPLYILTSFFVFNIEYPSGIINVCTYLEVELIKANASKVVASVKHFIAAVKQH